MCDAHKHLCVTHHALIGLGRYPITLLFTDLINIEHLNLSINFRIKINIIHHNEKAYVIRYHENGYLLIAIYLIRCLIFVL